MLLARAFTHAVLYVALAFGANTALAKGLDRSELIELRVGDMRKLAVHKEPLVMPAVTFLNAEDEVFDLGTFEGKYVLLNFWATWCAPCRKEMPSLDALQKELGGEKFEVVTMATGRNPMPAINKFFKEVNIEALTVYRDPKQMLARDMAVMGLPITVILNPEGQEIARMRGDADWHSADALKLLTALITHGD